MTWTGPPASCRGGTVSKHALVLALMFRPALQVLDEP